LATSSPSLARITEPSVARTVANRLFFKKDFLTHNQVCRFVTAHWVGLFINPYAQLRRLSA
jgi:hypothetical protein